MCLSAGLSDTVNIFLKQIITRQLVNSLRYEQGASILIFVIRLGMRNSENSLIK